MQFHILFADNATYYPDVANQSLFNTILLHPISLGDVSPSQPPSAFDTAPHREEGVKRAKTSHSTSAHPINSTSCLSLTPECFESSEKVNDFSLASSLRYPNPRVMAKELQLTLL